MTQEAADIVWAASRVFLRLQSLPTPARTDAIRELRLILATYLPKGMV